MLERDCDELCAKMYFCRQSWAKCMAKSKENLNKIGENEKILTSAFGFCRRE